MKYSLPFYVGNKYLDMVDEIMIKYDADNESSLIDFLDEHPNQRIVLRIAKENKILITFDNQIVSTESHFDLFSKKLNMNPVLDPYDVILEVKYNGFLLSYIKEMINSIDKSELSVSKYCLARQNAYQTHI